MVKKIFIGITIFILGMLVGLFCGKKLFDKGKYDQRMDEIMADDIEVERKWLIDKDKVPYDLNDKDVYVYDIIQTYLCFDPEIRVRNYNYDSDYEFTIKTNMSKDGVVRDEYNLNITKEEYENLVPKQEGNTIHKTRYQFYADDQLICIDIFHDDLDGLAYMEIEFPNKEESDAFETPSWVIKDVTDDIRYKNGHLARYGIPK
ncbi:CYTH domain-containing protein [Eubacterium ruminantium]|uniref:CYTH domain-containing protein n=1 Tax=Eubacterium ruminantium TaxID=42322 RepID=UPI0015691B20|nr:CYTH domain-containing protein [Eubacterium ruminantium]